MDSIPDKDKPAARPQEKSRKKSAIWNKNISRRNSREWALQLLFRLDFSPPDGTLEDTFEEFWNQYADIMAELNGADDGPVEEFRKPSNKCYRTFAESLVRNIWLKRDEIDLKIEGYLANWSLSRMGSVDRNVLRLAFYELFFSEDTPPVVVLNEAIDIAKYFSTRDSGKFVNGVLDAAMKDVARSPRAASFTPRKRKGQS